MAGDFRPVIGQPFDARDAHDAARYAIDVVRAWKPTGAYGKLSHLAKAVYGLFWDTQVRAKRGRDSLAGSLFYKQYSIAKQLGCEVRPVRRAIRELEQAGLLTVARPDMAAQNNYQLVWNERFFEEYGIGEQGPKMSHGGFRSEPNHGPKTSGGMGRKRPVAWDKNGTWHGPKMSGLYKDDPLSDPRLDSRVEAQPPSPSPLKQIPAPTEQTHTPKKQTLTPDHRSRWNQIIEAQRRYDKQAEAWATEEIAILYKAALESGEHEQILGALETGTHSIYSEMNGLVHRPRRLAA